MEDLREEPELEECEEEDDDDDENGEDEVDVEVDENERERKTNSGEEEDEEKEAEVLVRPVRKSAALSEIRSLRERKLEKPLLETNFSVTGLNEIRTKEIVPSGVDEIEIEAWQTRPVSLHLRGANPMTSFGYKKRPESIYVERVTAKLRDSP